MSFEEVFQRIEKAGKEGGFSRISESHPVDVFLGLDGGKRALMLIADTQPPEAPTLAALRIESRQRHDARWALVVRLEHEDLNPLFNRLVEDLDEVTRHRTEDPATAALARIARWQRLFAGEKPGVLSDEEIRGLAAEIDFFLSEAMPNNGADSASMAWVGPFDAPKDFAFPTVEIEVKAVHRQSRTVTISSLEQLTETGVPLFLSCRTVELVSVDEKEAVSFAALVHKGRASVAGFPAAVERIERALAAAGYEDRPEYDHRGVWLGDARCYRVADGFPRVQRTTTPAGVISAKYQISTQAIDAFRVLSWKEKT